MKYLALLAVTPIGLALTIYSAAVGWTNGRDWWELWRDTWFNRPSRVGLDKSGPYRTR